MSDLVYPVQIPKHHKRAQVSLGSLDDMLDDGLTIDEFESRLTSFVNFARDQARTKGLIEPRMVADIVWDYGGPVTWCVVGYVPMTDKEREQADRRAARAKETAAKRRKTKEEKELAELAKLKAKYPDV